MGVILLAMHACRDALLGAQACSAHTASTWGEAAREAAAADLGERATVEVGWVVVVAATAGRGWAAQGREMVAAARAAEDCNQRHKQAWVCCCLHACRKCQCYNIGLA